MANSTVESIVVKGYDEFVKVVVDYSYKETEHHVILIHDSGINTENELVDVLSEFTDNDRFLDSFKNRVITRYQNDEVPFSITVY